MRTMNRNRSEKPVAATRAEHICARHAICFQCFRAGVERARARRQAWLQRSLPFEAAAPQLTPREVAHRQRMLEHLKDLSVGSRQLSAVSCQR